MKNCSKAVKIVIGGRAWYYQTFFDEDATEFEGVRLYGEDGEFIKEFFSMEDMTNWILEKVNAEQRKAREKMQEAFMRRFEQLKGDMTDADFGVRLGMAGSSVYQYLVGRRFPSVGALAQIADKCGVSVDWLIGRDDDGSAH